MKAYLDLPLRNGKIFQLTERCSEAEIDAYRAWCKKCNTLRPN